MDIQRPQPVAALRETVELIRGLLAGEQVTMDGKVVRFLDGSIDVPGRADIEMVIATNGPQTLRLAGEICDGVIVQGLASEQMIVNVRALLAEGAGRAGRDPASLRLIARLDVCIAEDGQAARDQMRPGVVRHLKTHYPRFNSQRLAGIEIGPELAEAVSRTGYSLGDSGSSEVERMVPEELIDAQCIAGTIEDTADHVARLIDAGISEIIVRPVPLDGQDGSEILELFATESVPRARARSTSTAAPGGVSA
jgi:5,10-methylenetetrahydromethanopterin reductase